MVSVYFVYYDKEITSSILSPTLILFFHKNLATIFEVKLPSLIFHQIKIGSHSGFRIRIGIRTKWFLQDPEPFENRLRIGFHSVLIVQSFVDNHIINYLRKMKNDWKCVHKYEKYNSLHT